MAPERPDGPTDEELARAAGEGDRRPLEVLLERHADRLFAVSLRVLGDREDALDAAQEAMISIARSVGTFDERARFTTWSYRIAVNAALDVARRKRRAPVPAEALPEPASGTPPVDDRVAAELDVQAALAELPEEFRVAVVLRDAFDLEYTDIADILEVPIGTVRSRIARGRAALAVLLGNRPEVERRPRSDA